MNRLKKLVQLRKWELDEARRGVTLLEAQRAGLEHSIEKLEQDLAAEAALAGETFDNAAAYTRFADATRARQDKIRASMGRLDQEIDAQRGVVGTAFSEWKRVELLHDRQLQAERSDLARREQAELDELGRQRHVRG